jgi:glutamate synthase domain-containing protein 3
MKDIFPCWSTNGSVSVLGCNGRGVGSGCNRGGNFSLGKFQIMVQRLAEDFLGEFFHVNGLINQSVFVGK